MNSTKRIMISANLTVRISKVDIASKAKENTPWKHDVNRTYIKRSEDVRRFLKCLHVQFISCIQGDAIFAFQIIFYYP